MSLLSMIRGKTKLHSVLKEISPSKNSFVSNLQYPAFSNKVEIVVPYKLEKNNDAPLVGTASDYMFRFITAKTVEHNKDDAISQLSAENGLTFVSFMADKEFTRKIQKIFNEDIKTVRSFVYGEEHDLEEIVPVSLRFAYLEQCSRSNQMPKNIDDIINRNDPILLNDILELSKQFKKDFIDSKIISVDSNVVYNPRFGKWSIKCGGADADIYIDGTLYDFKCSKNVYNDWTVIGQLYGYYCLFRLCKMDHEEQNIPWINKPLSAIAIYNPRYGMINKCVIEESDADYSSDALQRVRSSIEEKSDGKERVRDLVESNTMFRRSSVVSTTRMIKRNIALESFGYKEGTRVYGGGFLGFGTIEHLYQEGFVIVKLDKGSGYRERFVDFYRPNIRVIVENVELSVGKRVLIPRKGEGKITKIDKHELYTEITILSEQGREITFNPDTEEWYFVRMPFPKIRDIELFPYQLGERAVLTTDKKIVTIYGFIEDDSGSINVRLKTEDGEIIKTPVDIAAIVLAEEKYRKDIALLNATTREIIHINEQIKIGERIVYIHNPRQGNTERFEGKVIEVGKNPEGAVQITVDFEEKGKRIFIGKRY